MTRERDRLTLQATNGHPFFGGITTVFDLRTKRIDRHVTFLGVYNRRDNYGFNELVGIGIKENYAEGGYSYMPVMMWYGGRLRYLATLNGGFPKFAKMMQEVSDATGLRMVEIPRSWGEALFRS